MDNSNKILISGDYNVFHEGWNSAGVYMISGLYISQTFKLPIYIGSSINLSRRIEVGHIYYLNNNKHPDNPILQSSWNKHGQDNFVVWLLEVCEPEYTLEREQYYLDKYQPFKDEFGGFNINQTVSGGSHPMSEETKKKISIANKGHVVSEESRNKMSKTRKLRLASGQIVNSRLGKTHPSVQKKIRCIDTGEIFTSIRDACKRYGLLEQNVGGVCRGIKKTCGKLHWEYVNKKEVSSG